MRTVVAVLGCLLACGCASSPRGSDLTAPRRERVLRPSGTVAAPPVAAEVVPTLLPAGQLYTLVYGKDKVVGYAFAEDGKKAGQQTIRWLLLNGYKSPTEQSFTVKRANNASDDTPLPATAKEFAAFARANFDPQTSIYVKTYADTMREMYTPDGHAKARSIVSLPVPQGRRPPDPPGQAKRKGAVDEMGRYMEIDGGTVGIRPPVPVGGGLLTGGRGQYLDASLEETQGVIGFAYASPMKASNNEVWFLSSELFERGIEGMVVGPYRPWMVAGDDLTASLGEAPALSEWVAVVTASSYYRNGVPNDW